MIIELKTAKGSKVYNRIRRGVELAQLVAERRNKPKEVIQVYKDTLCWLRYNDEMILTPGKSVLDQAKHKKEV